MEHLLSCLLRLDSAAADGSDASTFGMPPAGHVVNGSLAAIGGVLGPVKEAHSLRSLT